MTKSIRDIVALSLAAATVLCSTHLQPSKKNRLEQELERLRRQVQEMERTPREMWRQ